MNKNEIWNKFELRKADEGEKAEFGVDTMWKSPVPDDEEEVLVSDGVSIWFDTWYSGNDGKNLEGTDAAGLYWMSLPELPKRM